MTELCITYVNINVPRDRSQRTELVELCGTPGIPTMVCEDGKLVVDDDDAIIDYLEKNYGKQPRE
jgi:glutathione S-transferase